MKEELQWKAIEEKNATIKWGEFADLWSSSEDGWPEFLQMQCGLLLPMGCSMPMAGPISK
jgi:hypothetical protein